MASSSDIDEALQTISGKGSFRLGGNTVDVNVKKAIVGASVVRTIDGAPTVEWDIDDPHRTILRSGIYGEQVTMGVGDFTHELVSVSKQGTDYTITGEDQAVAALRRMDSPLKVKKGLMTHVEFAKKLVDEIPWLKFKTDPSAKAVKSKEDLTRGHVSKGQNQSSWDALTGNASSRGWRCFIRGVDEVWYIPDESLFKDDPSFYITEEVDGVNSIDGEYDKGQRLATLSVTCRSSLWQVPPGVTLGVYDMGLYDGKWLVQDITRSPFSLDTAITLIKPQPTLPEPTSGSGAGGAGTSGSGTPGSGKLSHKPAVRVAQYAMRAGFTGSKLETSVAVSFAENTGHIVTLDSPPNSDGSIDRGLWQINNKAHPDVSDAEAHDGQKNADAAYKISGKGNNWSPWTTFTSGAYKKYLPAARRAIAEAKKLDAESSGSNASNKGGGPAPDRSHSKSALDFVAEALSQRGKAYVYGAQTAPSNNDPKSFDCSLLVEWAAGRVGVTLPRTAQFQQSVARNHGTMISVKHAAHVRGAVLYEGNPAYHTAISLGNGETIEARGRAYGVNEFGIKGRPFSSAALIPGMKY